MQYYLCMGVYDNEIGTKDYAMTFGSKPSHWHDRKILNEQVLRQAVSDGLMVPSNLNITEDNIEISNNSNIATLELEIDKHNKNNITDRIEQDMLLKDIHNWVVSKGLKINTCVGTKGVSAEQLVMVSGLVNKDTNSVNILITSDNNVMLIVKFRYIIAYESRNNILNKLESMLTSGDLMVRVSKDDFNKNEQMILFKDTIDKLKDLAVYGELVPDVKDDFEEIAKEFEKMFNTEVCDIDKCMNLGNKIIRLFASYNNTAIVYDGYKVNMNHIKELRERIYKTLNKYINSDGVGIV